MCIYAITIMHKMYIHFAKNQTKKQGIYFRHIPSSTQQMGWFILLLVLFPPKKLESSSFLSWEREAKKRDPFFKICVSFKISQEEERESDLNFIETWTKEMDFWMERLRAKSSLNWFHQNYFPKFEHFDWLNSEISFDN